jgi:bacterial/archaeal transporter family protein
MLWWILVIISALCLTGQDIVRKTILVREHAHVMATARSISVAFMGLFLLPFIDVHLSFETLFFLYLASLIACFSVLYTTKAARHMEISVIAPLENISPAVVLIFAIIFLHEMPTGIRLFGIGLLALGAYLLEIRPDKHNYTDPLKIALTSPYVHFLLFAIIVNAGLSIFEKVYVVNYTTPATFIFFFYIFFMINFVIMHWYRYGLGEVKEEFMAFGQKYLLGAVFTVLATVTYLLALVVAPVTLVVPLRQVSTLSTTVVGGRFFKEQNNAMKVVACIIMLAGAYLLLR